MRTGEMKDFFRLTTHESRYIICPTTFASVWLNCTKSEFPRAGNERSIINHDPNPEPSTNRGLLCSTQAGDGGL
jgi:hypothetical protein